MSSKTASDMQAGVIGSTSALEMTTYGVWLIHLGGLMLKSVVEDVEESRVR